MNSYLSKEEAAVLLTIFFTYESESGCLYLDDLSIAPSINLQPFLTIPLEEFAEKARTWNPGPDENRDISLIAREGFFSSEDEKENALLTAHDWMSNTFLEYQYDIDAGYEIDWNYRSAYPFHLIETLAALRPALEDAFGEADFNRYFGSFVNSG